MVKYADGPSTEVAVDIDASARAVWSLVSDINVPGAFSEEFERAEWLDAGPALGATFRGYNRHPRVGEWNVVCTVTAFEPDRVFEWTVGDVDFKAARWRLEVEPVGSSECRLAFRSEIGPAPSGLTPAIERMPDREEDIVARRMSEHRANMLRTIEGIKALAEGDDVGEDQG